MLPNKVASSVEEATSDISEGSRIMVGGFGFPGTPTALVKALMDKGVGNLTCICGPWYAGARRVVDAAALIASGQVTRVITAPPVAPAPEPASEDDRMNLEIMPQGTLAERIRAGGAGIGGFYVPTGLGTAYEEGKERMSIDGVECIFEEPIKADYALIRAQAADTMGNLVYRMAQRNWNPIMATAAEVTIVQVDEIVDPGMLDPELVITPGIFVDRIVISGGDNDPS